MSDTLAADVVDADLRAAVSGNRNRG